MRQSLIKPSVELGYWGTFFTNTLTLLVFAGVFYLLFSFLGWDFNPLEWTLGVQIFAFIAYFWLIRFYIGKLKNDMAWVKLREDAQREAEEQLAELERRKYGR